MIEKLYKYLLVDRQHTHSQYLLKSVFKDKIDKLELQIKSYINDDNHRNEFVITNNNFTEIIRYIKEKVGSEGIKEINKLITRDIYFEKMAEHEAKIDKFIKQIGNILTQHELVVKQERKRVNMSIEQFERRLNKHKL